MDHAPEFRQLGRQGRILQAPQLPDQVRAQFRLRHPPGGDGLQQWTGIARSRSQGIEGIATRPRSEARVNRQDGLWRRRIVVGGETLETGRDHRRVLQQPLKQPGSSGSRTANNDSSATRRAAGPAAGSLATDLRVSRARPLPNFSDSVWARVLISGWALVARRASTTSPAGRHGLAPPVRQRRSHAPQNVERQLGIVGISQQRGQLRQRIRRPCRGGGGQEGGTGNGNGGQPENGTFHRRVSSTPVGVSDHFAARFPAARRRAIHSRTLGILVTFNRASARSGSVATPPSAAYQ